MRAPDHPAGQGARWQCGNPACDRVLHVQSVGRSRKFCSDKCRQMAHRWQNGKLPVLGKSRPDTLFRTDPMQGKGLSRNPRKTSTKSDGCKAVSGDRASPFKPVWKVVAGPPVSLANLIVPSGVFPPKPIQGAERAELIRRARELEFAARWQRRCVECGAEINLGRIYCDACGDSFDI
jgi:hypothetical protein